MSSILIIFLVVVFGLMFIGVPVGFSMLFGSAIYFVATGTNINAFVQQLLNGPKSFTLLAVPFFILAAQVMNGTNTTRKIFDFSENLVGHLPGGLCHVNVLTSVIFSGMSGSALADTAGIGFMATQTMIDKGYDKPFSAALTVASATVGPIIPPSIPMVIYSLVSGVSVGALFMGGVIPGLFLSLCLSVYCAIIAKKFNFPRNERVRFLEIIKSFLRSFFPLMTPVILLVCIYKGVCTPTEAAAICALYALIIGFFSDCGFRVKTYGQYFKKFGRICVDVVNNVGITLFVIICSQAFSWILARENVPQLIQTFASSIHVGKIGMLLIINALFLVLGMFFDVNTMQLAFVPIILPILAPFGINLLHFGVVIVINMMLGLITPPFGMQLFLISGLTKIEIKDILKKLWPMLLILVGVLLILILFEPIVTFLPGLSATGN